MKIKLYLLITALFFFSSCQNPYRTAGSINTSNEKGKGDYSGLSDVNAYQVHKDDYDNQFVSDFGLLRLKSSNEPFSGRILTIDGGENGEYVYSDENWSDGKKNGLSTKWFSNGVKMYERNYRDGKWHGAVTRWWPNGQKMYVRAYSKGIRHGKEATWRSDGTPVSLSSNFSPTVSSSDSANENSDQDDLPNIELPQENSAPADLPEQPLIAPEASDVELPQSDSVGTSADDLPELPPLDDSEDLPDLPPLDLSGDLPPVSPDSELDPLPALDDTSSFDSPDDLPALPELDLSDSPPSDSDTGDEAIPADDLPPLPSGDAGFDDLPPLPPLP